MTKTIPLTQGQYTVVDDEDCERVSQHLWQVTCDRNGRFYAARTVKNGEKRTHLSLHRFILDAPIGLFVDHINGDSLDNRRTNLRVCTASQNSCNRGKTRLNQSGHKGVCRRKGSNRWVAQIEVEGRKIHLGAFDTAEKASVAYDEAAMKYHGDFAVLNESNPIPRAERSIDNVEERVVLPQSRSGYFGVYPNKDRWAAKISIAHKSIHIGTFDTPEEAARNFDAAAIHYRGKGTRTNFPQDEEE